MPDPKSTPKTDAKTEEEAEVLLTEGDIPVAKLVPVEAQTGKRIPNLHPGGWISEDFDDPLPDEFWLGEE